MPEQNKIRPLESRHFYTPDAIYETCVGITPNIYSCVYPDSLRFRFELRDGIHDTRITSAIGGQKGLLDLKRQIIERGFEVPETMGEVYPLKFKRLTVHAKSILVRIPDTFVTHSDRVYLKYDRTFGSFNSAMYSALRLLSIFDKMSETMQLQRDIINQVDGLSHADSGTLVKYLKNIHSLDSELPTRKSK